MQDDSALRLDRSHINRPDTPGLNICQAFGQIGLELRQVCRLKRLVRLKQAQRFTNDFTRGSVQTGGDMLAHPIFQFDRQRDV
ncbi:hypothetical protein ACCAA_1160018 [Candidatus Accumulibacter aalborgensis]|uniref:Uncharacterized protein n=1 Tax=Candidatus Accumulibacter aalborgensis TaxID=1860102 RepID=A0A1A8XHJ8_9PROT|nr:hypothetical protein ACCAA_1160018 [Candidatus Accumulibacter aalborgensis]